MSQRRSLNEVAKTTKELLSYEELQLAIGEFSITSAGYFLAYAGVERNNFLSIMIGGITGNEALLAGLRHLKSARQKLRQRQIPEDMEQ